jgi:hypothetical protein
VVAPVAESVTEPVEEFAGPATVPETATEPQADSAPTPVAEQSAPPTIQPTSRLTDLPKRQVGATAKPAASAPESVVEPKLAGWSEPVGERAPAALAANDILDGDWEDPGDDDFDTPIFRSLRSAWLSPDSDAQPWRSSEIEAGWEMADQVAEIPAEPEVSPSGLPVRRPGSRLVPGGVTPPPTATVRDAEAIRTRLAAHASGVSRGRAAATAAPDPSLTEAGS